MNKKVIIIGLGIGKLYETVLAQSKKYTFEVITVDTDSTKNPTYTDITECINDHPKFDLGIICTPNHLHANYVKSLSPICTTVLVEKPGLSSLHQWNLGFKINNNIFLIKNNMFRKNIKEIKKYINDNSNSITGVELLWLNKDRIPNPGSWFTNKKLAFSGVSSDLIPHLLSIYYALVDDEFIINDSIELAQNYTLDTISDTEYGTVNKDGVYDVDDYCKLDMSGNIPFALRATWKDPNLKKSKIEIRIHGAESDVIYDLGLCPEETYLKMIESFIDSNYKFRDEQIYIDQWIHKCLDKIREKEIVCK